VHWPAVDADADGARPRDHRCGRRGGERGRLATLVARFPRLWVLEGKCGRAGGRTALAAAPFEPKRVAGCIRDVRILVDEASDLTLRTPFRALSAAIACPMWEASAHRKSWNALYDRVASGGKARSPRPPRLRDRNADRRRGHVVVCSCSARLLLIAEARVPTFSAERGYEHHGAASRGCVLCWSRHGGAGACLGIGCWAVAHSSARQLVRSCDCSSRRRRGPRSCSRSPLLVGDVVSVVLMLA
jgi:hypothetical protein